MCTEIGVSHVATIFKLLSIKKTLHTSVSFHKKTLHTSVPFHPTFDNNTFTPLTILSPHIMPSTVPSCSNANICWSASRREPYHYNLCWFIHFNMLAWSRWVVFADVRRNSADYFSCSEVNSIGSTEFMLSRDFSRSSKYLYTYLCINAHLLSLSLFLPSVGIT